MCEEGNAKIVKCCKNNPLHSSLKAMKFVIGKYLCDRGADPNWIGEGERKESMIEIAIK